MTDLSIVLSPPNVGENNTLLPINEGFLLFDRDFVVLDANAETLRLNQCHSDKLVGHIFWEACPSFAGTLIETAYRTVMQKRSAVTFKYQFRLNTHVSWYEIRAYPVQEGMAAFYREITETETALQALQDSERRFRAATAATGVMWTNDADGRMKDEQPGWAGLTGQSRTEYENFGWAAAVHPDDAEPTVTAWNAAVAERRTFEFEHRVLRHDGVWRSFSIKAVPVVDPAGAVKEWVGVHTDITERKQNEQALSIKETRLRLATDVAGVGIWTCNLQTDTVTWENQQIYKIFGMEHGAHPLGTQQFCDRFEDSDDALRFQAALKKMRAEPTHFYFQARMVRANDGAVRWIELHGEPYQNDLPVRGILGTVMDITERKMGEEALRATANELIHADRRKSEFIATVAHELRNPLAPIRNCLQVLRMTATNPETVARVTGVMERQVRQMVHLIEDLLDVTRISRGEIELQRELVDLKQVAAVGIETSLPLIEARRHDLSIDISEEPLMLLVDAKRIAQVISNLLNNAAKYTPEEGRICLAAKREVDTVVLSITDTGIGIPPTALMGIFDMFSQVDEHRSHAQGGLGIGLALVRKLVEMHGGTVKAFSNGSGLGSAFEVRLPAALS